MVTGIQVHLVMLSWSPTKEQPRSQSLFFSSLLQGKGKQRDPDKRKIKLTKGASTCFTTCHILVPKLGRTQPNTYKKLLEKLQSCFTGTECFIHNTTIGQGQSVSKQLPNETLFSCFCLKTRQLQRQGNRRCQSNWSPTTLSFKKPAKVIDSRRYLTFSSVLNKFVSGRKRCLINETHMKPTENG